MHGHDATNSSRNPSSSGPRERPTTAWTLQLTDSRRYGHDYPAPVVSGESVFVGGDGLRVLDLDHGAVRERAFGGDPTFGPAVVDGTAFVATRVAANTVAVRSLDAATLDERWRTEVSLGEEPRVRPLVATGDRVYATIGYGNPVEAPPNQYRLVALDAEPGDRLWSIDNQAEWYSPPPAVRDGVVYADGGPRSLPPRAIGPECDLGCRVLSDPPTRTWTAETSVFTGTAPVVDGETVYFADQHHIPPSRGGWSGSLWAFSTADGSVEWREQLGFHVTSPAVVDGTVYTASMVDNGRESGHLYGTDATAYAFEDGERRWQTPLPSRRTYGTPVAAGDLLYLGTLPSQVSDAPPRIHALSLDSGAVRWAVDLPAAPCSLAVANGTLLASGWDGTLVALR